MLIILIGDDEQTVSNVIMIVKGQHRHLSTCLLIYSNCMIWQNPDSTHAMLRYAGASQHRLMPTGRQEGMGGAAERVFQYIFSVWSWVGLANELQVH